MSGAAGSPDPPPSPPSTLSSDSPAAHEFRWQALFQRTREPVFVLNRRRRFLFVNRAWEILTGLSAAEARGLACVRRPPIPQDPWDVVIRAVCCPPQEVLKGRPGRSRRLVPGKVARWWDVEFFPLHADEGLLCIVGKVSVVPGGDPAGSAPLPERIVAYREGRKQHYTFASLASKLPAGQRVAEQARLAAQTDAPVLLLGEPGTGKEWIARTIHYQSAAGAGPFAALDCARLPPEALQALLFGEQNLQQNLRSGTLCLKEAQCLPRELQMRLLETLPSGEAADRTRVIAAVSVDPALAIASGDFLEPLYCVLSTLNIHVPALRERLPDLPRFIEEFLKRAQIGGEQRVTGVTDEALDQLRAYAWPGNLRELYAVLQAACLRSSGDRIEPGHLPSALRVAVRLDRTPGSQEEKPLNLDQVLEKAERRLIQLALRKAKGNRSRAAELLSIWRARLIRRMEALGIEDW
ncbi:MAG: PAS domain-containing protein [Planctomycetota bacterium]|nr:MAG: PAS domain-containing protein [Planctomycetota bacterium]